jgi:hypothetical protein
MRKLTCVGLASKKVSQLHLLQAHSGAACTRMTRGGGEEVQEQASRKGGSTVASKMMLFIREGLLELSTDQGVLPECTYFTGKPPDIIEDLLYDLQTEFPEVFFCVCVRTCVCVCVRMCVCVFACVRGRVRG